MKNESQIIIYQTERGDTKIEISFQDETVWLNQKLMAELFQVKNSNKNEHIQNIYKEKELEKDSYFDELLHRIQDIRTSERRFYQKITDIYGTSVDFVPTLDVSIKYINSCRQSIS